MPVTYKHWFLKRLEKELSKEGSSQETSQRPSTPQRSINLRQLQNIFKE